MESPHLETRLSQRLLMDDNWLRQETESQPIFLQGEMMLNYSDCSTTFLCVSDKATLYLRSHPCSSPFLPNLFSLPHFKSAFLRDTPSIAFRLCFSKPNWRQVLYSLLVTFSTLPNKMLSMPSMHNKWKIEDKRRGVIEDEMFGWHHWLNGHESEQTQGDSGGQGGLPGVLQFMGSQRVEHYLATDYWNVWMWELDCEEGWAPKNWCFWTVVLEKTLESPLDCKEI